MMSFEQGAPGPELIQMAADVGKGVYRRQQGMPEVLQAPLDSGLGHPRNAFNLHLIALHRHNSLAAP